jgi:hypothetical protein
MGDVKKSETSASICHNIQKLVGCHVLHVEDVEGGALRKARKAQVDSWG